MREWLGHRNIKNTAIYTQLVTRDAGGASEPEG
jgi:site-specific recombinase XerC